MDAFYNCTTSFFTSGKWKGIEMKKRNIVLIMVLIIISAFFVGRKTVIMQNEKEINIDPEYDMVCDVMESIIDFNTDGYELSVILEDGTEVYAYRKENIDAYKGNRIVKTNGNIATKKNGEQYYIYK